MEKISVEDLDSISQRTIKKNSLNEGTAKAKITVHLGTCGIAAGAREIAKTLVSEIELRNITDVILTKSGCAGLCSREPMVTVELEGEVPVKYVDLTSEKIKTILQTHVLDKKIVKEYAYVKGYEKLY